MRLKSRVLNAMLTALALVAMAAPAHAQGRNDSNDPPPIPRPTPGQMAGLSRLDRLVRYLATTPGGTAERFVHRELSLPRTSRADLPVMARYFGLSEAESRRLLAGRPGGEDTAWRVYRHLHWWSRYVSPERG